jgi:hypothetical protein
VCQFHTHYLQHLLFMSYLRDFHRCTLAIFSGLAALALAPHVSTAALYTETWTAPGDFRNWSAAKLGTGTGGDTFSVSGGVVNFSITTGAGPFQRGFQLSGSNFFSPLASGGNFQRNTVAAGANFVRFDFALDSDTLGTSETPQVVLTLGGVANSLNSYWEYRWTPPSIGGGLATFVADLNDPTGWVQTLGNATLQEARTDVLFWTVSYRRSPGAPNSGFSASGRVDNFGLAAVPEPASSALLAAGLILGWSACRRRRGVR